MVGAKPVLVRKQQARLSDFYPVTLPEVQTATQQMQNIPATTQTKASSWHQHNEDLENNDGNITNVNEIYYEPREGYFPEVSPLSAEQQLNMHLDELRAKTENPEDIVQQFIEDMRNEKNVHNVPRKLRERTENELLRNLRPLPVSEVNEKFGRIRFPSKEFANENIPENMVDSLRRTKQFRDYFGRQTTLPEHFPSYHTEDWLDPETGLVREGAIAPVTAVRRANSRDIMGGMAQTGGGLIPLPNSSNESFENRNSGRRPMLMQSQNPPLEHFQSGYFLTTPYVADLDRSVTVHDTDALIGVRGFGAPSGDVFQARPAGEAKEGATEAVVHSRIAPERLVPLRYNDSYQNLIRGDENSKPSFLTLNDIRNFFRPKTSQDFRQAIGREKDDTISRNQKFDYIRDHLPFMQFAPPEFNEMVDRHGMPAALTDDEKNRFLEAMEEEDNNYHRDMTNKKRKLGNKLALIRNLGATDWWDRPDKGDVLTLRDLTLPSIWGDPMAALANAPPHTKDALIELFNHRFNTNYPTNKKLKEMEESIMPTIPKKKTQFEELNELFG